MIRRRGRDVCVMEPPPVLRRRASECLALLRDRSVPLLDDRFGADLDALLAEEAEDERPAWDS